MNENTLEIWRGKSELDGQPIVLLASGFNRATDNGKTGDMIQTWIMRADIPPNLAAKSGADVSVCGHCLLRGSKCYVLVWQAPLAIWKSWNSGNVATLSPVMAGAVIRDRGYALRAGSYGDPAAVPFSVWRRLINPKGLRTGYTHQWRTADPRLRPLIMASVDTVGERREAMRMGWRTFRVRSHGEPLRSGEIMCPASDEAGKRTTCAQCHLCDGRTRGDRRPTIAIIAHGAGATS